VKKEINLEKGKKGRKFDLIGAHSGGWDWYALLFLPSLR
jgi:hypothetical protein